MFFSLGLAFGTMITFSSYLPKNNPCAKDAYTVVLVNCGTSIFAGIAVFAILGYRELQTGIDAAKVCKNINGLFHRSCAATYSVRRGIENVMLFLSLGFAFSRFSKKFSIDTLILTVSLCRLKTHLNKIVLAPGPSLER